MLLFWLLGVLLLTIVGLVAIMARRGGGRSPADHGTTSSGGQTAATKLNSPPDSGPSRYLGPGGF